jgi:hypothetical protein
VNGNQNSINIARRINSIELSSITIHGDAIKGREKTLKFYVSYEAFNRTFYPSGRHVTVLCEQKEIFN